MRTRFFRAAAFAAVAASATAYSSPGLSGGDLYDAAPVYDIAPVPPQDLFEGWWLGGTIGGASVSYDKTPASSVSSSGIVGGIVGGYSWQHGPFVIGVEGDFLASDVSGSHKYNGGLNTVSPGFDMVADLRLRAGYTVLPNLFLFGTFGGSWVDADLSISGLGGAFRETTFFGWSVGGGAEYAFDENWGARLDYQFTDFDAETVSYPGGKETFDPDSDTFRGSLIYRF
ncbi:MAG: outer membrane protein [Alphaproteobacteria bacterium]